MPTRTCRQCGLDVERSQYADHKANHRLASEPRRQSFKKLCRYCGQLVLAGVPYSEHIDAHKLARGELRTRTRAFRQVREAAFRRSAGQCAYCGRAVGVSDGDWQLHHRDGRAGNDDPANLAVICSGGSDSCHAQLTRDFRAGC
jgi:5-methylcytosine-specific restriction endonuclease McrA